MAMGEQVASRTRSISSPTRRKIFLTGAVALLLAVSSAGAVFGLSADIGNPATDRDVVDEWYNFTMVDANNPAAFDGTFTAIEYWAERAGGIRFVIVDSTDQVTWVSDVIYAQIGQGTETFAGPVGVTAGSNLGVYSVIWGVISFDFDQTAATGFWTLHGLPVVGEVLVPNAPTHRYYSMNATITASSPDVCKAGGWESFGYKNQGQCIASIVANENAGK